MKKGRFSFVIGCILTLLGILACILGVLNMLELLDGVLFRIAGDSSRLVSISGGKGGLVEAGAFLLFQAFMVFLFRSRRPFSMPMTALLVILYLTLLSAHRVSNSIPLPSYLPVVLASARPWLLFVLFFLETLLFCVILSILKPIDARWRKKRDVMMRKLEKEGAVKSREKIEEEKMLRRQLKLNEKAEKEKARDERRYSLELEKKEKAERKKAEKEREKEKRVYEKTREKEELKRERESERERRRRDRENDRLLEKKENEEERIRSEKERQERQKRKEEEKKAKEEKRREKMTLPDIGPAPEYEEMAGSPDTPLSFPSFEEMPSLKTIGHHSERNRELKRPQEERTDLIESSSFMDSLKKEMETENSIRTEEDEERKAISETRHFRGGGMLEAALEACNSEENETSVRPPLSPIIGLDDRKTDEEKTGNGNPSGFAPHNLDPSHPRYRMFEALRKAPEANADEENASDTDRQNFAPHNLDPSHPRYRMFESLNNPVSSSSAAPEMGKDLSRPLNEERQEKRTESPAPSYIGKDHPRYRLFEALEEKGGEKESIVSYTPGRSFSAEDESAVVNPYQPSSVFTPDEAGTEKERDEEKEKGDISAESMTERTETKDSAYSAEEKTTQKVDTAPEKDREIPFVEPENPRIRNVETSDDGHRTFETRSDEEMDDDFNLIVGVGDLASNRGGLTAVRMRQMTDYNAPDVSVLKDYPGLSQEIDSYTREQGEVIVRTLAEQRISVELDNIIKGPSVTRYELKLAQGMIISRIKAREDEINYALGGKKVRILAPVPGKQAVGIEVPNARISVVGFKDMVYALRNNPDYLKFRVPMILGRTVTGEPIVIDVAKMPHMIIAGTTGSGKSVCINSFVNTVIYQKSPKDVRLIMVDPKVVELTIYNGIPHLLTPVITDAKKAIKALEWLVSEMERRYSMLSRYGVRNVQGLNEKIMSGEITGVEKVPYIVLIMDEFADIMTVVGKEMDAAISRIAAKARAAGIHMILATQRPSSDVIIGTLKSNLPGRIAFAVSSGINSRVILDEMGAENLLGKGDMLLLDPSVMGLTRIQGAFVSDSEVEKITSFVSLHNSKPDFLEESVFEDDEGEEDDDEVFMDDEGEGDLYEMAKKIVYERKCASASYLQRRLKIGYNRAARIVEKMEEEGIVGPANGSKPREILRYE